MKVPFSFLILTNCGLAVVYPPLWLWPRPWKHALSRHSKKQRDADSLVGMRKMVLVYGRSATASSWRGGFMGSDTAVKAGLRLELERRQAS